MTHLDPKALEAVASILAFVWPGGFEDQSVKPLSFRPNSAAREVATKLVTTYLAALPQAEPVEFHVTDRKNGIDYTERRASPTPAVSRPDRDSVRIAKQFADMYQSGAQGAEMDCDAAQALALSIADILAALSQPHSEKQ